MSVGAIPFSELSAYLMMFPPNNMAFTLDDIVGIVQSMDNHYLVLINEDQARESSKKQTQTKGKIHR